MTDPARVPSHGAHLEFSYVSFVLSDDDIRPEALQFLFEVLIAALDVVDVGHRGAALGGKTRQHQCSAGSQVAGFDLRGGEPLNSRDDCSVPFYLEDGAQLIEYLDQENNPMLSNLGYGAIYKVFDDQGRQIFEMWLDIDGKPLPNEAGVSGMSREFLDDGRILWTNLDAEQHPVADADSEISTLITLDEEGREISKICLDADLNPYACNDGWIRRDMEYDEQGEVVSNMFYDADGNPMPDNNGDYGRRLLPVEHPNEEWIENAKTATARLAINEYLKKQKIR